DFYIHYSFKNQWINLKNKRFVKKCIAIGLIYAILHLKLHSATACGLFQIADIDGKFKYFPPYRPFI
ncbi:hypothetical protein, partial [Neisseria dentiae]|uniref:hypothetical protein n=1 Tax=Neisseria dentiae TaxID=194197 RepID=UPI0035A120BC